MTLSTEVAEGEALDVPLLWLWAEKAAQDLIVAVEGPVSPATFEFRATRDVLALTLFLDDDTVRSPIDLSAHDLERIRDHLAEPPNWLDWCRSRLDQAECLGGVADRRLAMNAWRWLGRGRLLSDVGVVGVGCGEVVSALPAASCVGLVQARHVIGQHLVRQR